MIRILVALVTMVALATPLELQSPITTANPRWVGLASWYGKECSSEREKRRRLCGEDGLRTYCGHTFNRFARSVAVPTELGLRCGATVRVTRRDTGATISLPITDRLPSVWVARGRIADLSYGAARQLGMVSAGLVEVELEEIR